MIGFGCIVGGAPSAYIFSRTTMTKTKKLAAAEVTAIFRRLRALKASFGFKPNKDDRTTALIGACIAEGFDSRPQIIGALSKLEIPRAHVESLLSRYLGDDPDQHLWRLGEDQRYCLLDRYA
jgi:hypothetical protein